MAQLTEEQKKTVAQWTAEGASLNDVQDRLKREFDLTLTYLDARLLVMELGLKLQEKKQQEVKPEEAAPSPEAPGPEDGLGEEGLPQEFAEAELMDDDSLPGAPSSVSVSLDAITLPGTMVSGKVTFSDGKVGGWYVDQMGRLGLQPPEPGYQPSQADIPAFQRELDTLLRQRGF